MDRHVIMHTPTAGFLQFFSLCFLLLTLSACGGDDGDLPSTDPNADQRPVFLAIENENKVIQINETFNFPLLATDPNGDPLVFDFANSVPFPNTHIRDNTSIITGNRFTWTPIINDWDPLLRYYRFNEEFVVSDNATPEPFQATQKVVFTVVDSAGGKVYMMHCAECHGVEGDGVGALLPDGSVGVSIVTPATPENLPLLDLDDALMLDLMSAGNGVPEMQYLNELITTTEDITAVVDYVNVLRTAK